MTKEIYFFKETLLRARKRYIFIHVSVLKIIIDMFIASPDVTSID